ncbi:MAG: hypothetical protein SCALA702_23230 [Melioribacteraceae bacterium]|nr:MAG: hypothetical protein SCALA702_23230 [Melioribacteraceae bacterium]
MILITEDDSISQAILKKLLSTNNYKYELASNGQEAIDKSKAQKFDVILMDILMPKKDGFTASEEIRASNDNPNFNTPIIAVTSESYQDNRERFEQCGINDFLPKPVRKESLLKKIDQWKGK